MHSSSLSSVFGVKTLPLVAWNGDDLGRQERAPQSVRAFRQSIGEEHFLQNDNTNTLSTIDEPVPLMWIEAAISAGHGSEALQVSPASTMETAIG